MTGTPMKDISPLGRLARAPVRFKKSGSLEISGTTKGKALWKMRPITPSPSR
jgi:hypothetical protein